MMFAALVLVLVLAVLLLVREVQSTNSRGWVRRSRVSGLLIRLLRLSLLSWWLS